MVTSSLQTLHQVSVSVVMVMEPPSRYKPSGRQGLHPASSSAHDGGNLSDDEEEFKTDSSCVRKALDHLNATLDLLLKNQPRIDLRNSPKNYVDKLEFCFSGKRLPIKGDSNPLPQHFPMDGMDKYSKLLKTISSIMWTLREFVTCYSIARDLARHLPFFDHRTRESQSFQQVKLKIFGINIQEQDCIEHDEVCQIFKWVSSLSERTKFIMRDTRNVTGYYWVSAEPNQAERKEKQERSEEETILIQKLRRELGERFFWIGILPRTENEREEAFNRELGPNRPPEAERRLRFLRYSQNEKDVEGPKSVGGDIAWRWREAESILDIKTLDLGA